MRSLIAAFFVMTVLMVSTAIYAGEVPPDPLPTGHWEELDPGTLKPIPCDSCWSPAAPQTLVVPKTPKFVPYSPQKVVIDYFPGSDFCVASTHSDGLQNELLERLNPETLEPDAGCPTLVELGAHMGFLPVIGNKMPEDEIGRTPGVGFLAYLFVLSKDVPR